MGKKILSLMITVILIMSSLSTINLNAEESGKTAYYPEIVTGDNSGSFNGGTCPPPYKGVSNIDLEEAFMGDSKSNLFVAIPTGRYITFEFSYALRKIGTAELVIETTGNDAAAGKVYTIQYDGTEVLIGSIVENKESQITSFTLEDLSTLKAIKIVGTNNKGSYPGLDVVEVFIRGEGTPGGDKWLTSTISRFRANYNNLINSFGEGAKYSDYAEGLYKRQDAAVIPGLERTNMAGLGINDVNEDMVPQGVCVAGKYMLISAYHHHEEGEKADPSVIFVLDNNTKKYLTTLVLTGTTSRTFAGCHVGAITYDKKGIVYLADSRNVGESKVDNGKIWKIEFSKIDDAAQAGKDAVPIKVTEKFPVDINPSFLSYYGGNLLVGNFNKSSIAADEMMIYGTDGTPRTNKTIAIPGKCQGIGVTEIGKYTYMFCSCSYGAGDTLGVIPNFSKIIVYRFGKGNDGDYSVLLENKAYLGILSNENRFKLFLAPHMSEDIEIQGNTIFVCHESGANEYNARCPYPLDIITEGSVSKYLSLPSSINDSGYSVKSAPRKAETEFSGEEEVIDEGYCGDNAYYVLYSNGVMNITGGGAIYDFEGEEPPWKSHLLEIKELYIGADISIIGSEAFKGSVNLNKVEVSDFSNEEEQLVIRDKAFDGCNNLEEIVLPGKDYQFSDSSFSSNPVVYSEDLNVLNYAQGKQLDTHRHTFEFREKVDPTCGNQGYSIYVCSCGAEEYRDITDPDHSSHTYKEIDHVDATEKTGGYTEYICTVCGEGKMETTEPTGKEEEGTTAAPSESTTQNKADSKISKISISGISKQIAAGKSIRLTSTVLPKNAANKKLKWTSSNTKVATVTQAGKVKIKKGTGGKSVTITAAATDGSGKKATFKIKVMKGSVKSIKIKGAKKTLKVGKTMKLKATVKVTKGKPVNKKVKWTSSNRKYATVSSKGVVKAQKEGKGKKVKITAMATDGTGKKKVVTIKIK